MSVKKGRLAGDDLRAATGRNIDTIREDAGIGTAEKGGLTSTALALLRRFGNSLFVVATLAIVMWKDAKNTGAFDGLGFSLDDLTAAANRIGDLDFVSTDLGKLARDARLDATAAKVDLARMLDILLRARDSMLAHPTDPKGIRPTMQRSGQKIDEALAIRRKALKESRVQKAAARGKDAIIEQQASELHKSQTKEAITEAQKDLKLQVYSGETLRPEDLVVATLPGTDAATAGTTSQKGKRRPGARRPKR